MTPATDGIKKYGFKVKLDHVFPEKRSQFMSPRLCQIWGFLTLVIRYVIYSLYIWCKGRTLVMDYFKTQDGKRMYGVPIGGIGSGTIGRGFKGEFCRYQLKPGMYYYETIYANQFIVTIKNQLGKTLYQKPLTSAKPPKNVLKSWDWTFSGENGEYTGLYPRSWTTFHIPEQDIVLTCRQISPVIPHNYKDSCIPAAVFVWDVENNGTDPKLITITFTFQSGIGDKGDRDAGCYNEVFVRDSDGYKVTGVLVNRKIDGMPCTFAVSGAEKDGVHASCLKEWNPLGDGRYLWDLLKNQDSFPQNQDNEIRKTRKGEQIACATSLRSNVPSKSAKKFEFSLAWHMPVVHFGERKYKYSKYYTKFFGRDTSAACDIVCYCLRTYPEWELEIEKWQDPVLSDDGLPSWFKSALFNETYFVSDGGSIWIDIDDFEKHHLDKNDVRIEYGRFAYLEGHEYRMYNTYDVHFYASFALAMQWPKLQAVIQKDFCDAIPQENRSRQWHLSDGSITFRKVKDSIPHDLGDPGEEPFLKINSYPIHDVSQWRDLGVKFVLQCYRDYYLFGDLFYLRGMWKSVCTLMRVCRKWDRDGDGLIENHDCADQTYDSWTMSGPSAYCGILWLAAVQCTCEMAKILSDNDVFDEFKALLDKAKSAVNNKLWNGSYYNFDCSPRRDTIMSDQLCGLWYIKSCGLENEILPEENVLKALKTIYENNVLKFKNGSAGAVNGMMPDGKIDVCTLQSEETWTGVVYSLASLMIHQGMIDEGFHTASGIYKTVYEKIGLGYETPEALYEKKSYRAIGYMRPLSIWSIWLAWNVRKKSQAR